MSKAQLRFSLKGSCKRLIDTGFADSHQMLKAIILIPLQILG